MYIFVYSIGLVGSLIAQLYLFIMYFINKKYIINIKGDIVESRFLSKEEIKVSDGGLIY